MLRLFQCRDCAITVKCFIDACNYGILADFNLSGTCTLFKKMHYHCAKQNGIEQIWIKIVSK